MQGSTQLIADRGMGEPISLGAALVAGKKVAPDATLLLAQDHLEAFSYFDWVEQCADDAAASAVIMKLCAALKAHMIVEEEILYPAAQEALDDDELIEHAYEEHEGAKALIQHLIAPSADSPDRDSCLQELRQAIEEHVSEEESELFPRLRETNLNLYELGRQIAARRADALLELTGRADPDDPHSVREMHMTPVSKKEAQALFVAGLKDAHAAARQCKEMVESQVERLEQFPEVEERLRAHLAEKEAQLERLETVLDSLGEKRSVLKDTAMAVAGNVMAMGTMPAGDEILKNSLVMSGMANFEVASLESLLLLGEAAGQPKAIKQLQLSLSEERAMAAWLAENLRGVLTRHLQLRSEGKQASH